MKCESERKVVLLTISQGKVREKGSFTHLLTMDRTAKRILRSQGNREGGGPLPAKRAENFQGLEINFGKLLLVYFMRPPRP